MNKTICPGQDTRFWQPGDIFNSRCGNCGSLIEFFKDDASQRCKKCGTKVQNPKLNMGCAQWCEHAKECLGYDPKDAENAAAAAESVGYDISLADKILGEIKLKSGEDSELFRHAKKYREKAEQLIDSKGGKPRIIIPAAMLIDAGPASNTPGNTMISGTGNNDMKNTLAWKILKEVELDSATIDEVAEIINALNRNVNLESNEFRIVSEVVNSFHTHQ